VGSILPSPVKFLKQLEKEFWQNVKKFADEKANICVSITADFWMCAKEGECYWAVTEPLKWNAWYTSTNSILQSVPV
jgi:hypothetical protein